MDLRNQTLIVNCGGESFTGDLVWSAEALGNILKNCMEHTPEGGTITVTAQETALYTRIEVEDTGSGFDRKDIPHLFERFYRVDKGRSRQKGGTGLGLAIVKHAVQFHGGAITASNRPNGGLRFDFILRK